MLSDRNDDSIEAVLIASTDGDLYQSIDHVLRDLGAVGVRYNPSDDLSALDTSAFSAVFVDARLDGANQFATQLKALAGQKDAFLPLVLVGSIESIAQHGLDAFSSFDDVISAPVRKMECAIRLSSLLKRRSAISSLVQANAMLKRAQEKKKALAALVVHDLRNPLAAILGNIQLLRDGPTLSDPEDRQIGEDLETLAYKAMSLVASLLDVEELEEGLLQPNPQQVELAPFFERFPLFYQTMLRARNVSLVFNHDDIVAARFDEELMFRVIENLLDNSVRYAAKDGKVWVQCEQDGDDLRLRIANDGPEIPESERERIFERYYRLNARRQGARANRGLGLYFCKLACEAQGGSISVTNLEGYPGCFEIRLPNSKTGDDV